MIFIYELLPLAVVDVIMIAGEALLGIGFLAVLCAFGVLRDLVGRLFRRS